MVYKTKSIRNKKMSLWNLQRGDWRASIDAVKAGADQMGLILGRWRFPGREPPSIAEVERALREATGLQIDRSDDGRVLELPSLREALRGWEYDGDSLTLHGYVPPHPYLWENVDRVMMAMGGRCDNGSGFWQPSSRHTPLRRRWDALPSHDRWLLRLSSVAGLRLLDRFLSGRRSAKLT